MTFSILDSMWLYLVDLLSSCFIFFFFKQKTAYEMRISDWSSDVCSSDLAICGTDIHIYQWDDWASKTIPVPLAIGHEFCGEIVQCGSEIGRASCRERVCQYG